MNEKSSFIAPLIIFLAFIGAFFATFAMQTRLAEDNAFQLIGLKIEDVCQQIKISDKNLQKIRADNNNRLLIKSRIFAELLQTNPTIAKSNNKLKGIKDLLAVKELNIIDKNGIVTNSTTPDIVGFDMSTSEQAATFLPILEDDSLEIVQEPMPRSYEDNAIMQYAGVARKDIKGIIQIAHSPDLLTEAMEIADIKNFAAGFRIGTEGSVLIVQDNTIISTNNISLIGKPIEAYGINPNDLQSNRGKIYASHKSNDKVCSYENTRNFTIIGCIPDREVYLSRDTVMWQLMVLHIVLFLIVLFFIVKRED